MRGIARTPRHCLHVSLTGVSQPVPQGAVCSTEKGLLLHVVDGQFTGQVGLPPDCLVAVQGEKRLNQEGKKDSSKKKKKKVCEWLNNKVFLPQHLLSVALHLNHHCLFIRLSVLLLCHLLQILRKDKTYDFYAIHVRSNTKEFHVCPYLNP